MDNTELITETAVSESPCESKDAPQGKKPFVTPEITFPVDVLDATTFFQAVDSGQTN